MTGATRSVKHCTELKLLLPDLLPYLIEKAHHNALNPLVCLNLAVARSVEAIAEHDLGSAVAIFGVCLHVLRKDLLLMSIAMDLEPMSTLMSTAKKLETAKASQALDYSYG